MKTCWNVLRKRIDALNFDGFLEYLLCRANDRRSVAFSLLPNGSLQSVPIKAQAALLEGRIIILLTGSPNALILPVSFWSFFKPWTTLRFTIGPKPFRILSFFGNVFYSLLPALYIAVLSISLLYIVPLNLFVNIGGFSIHGNLFSPRS